MKKGWRNESIRHSLAARGIRTYNASKLATIRRQTARRKVNTANTQPAFASAVARRQLANRPLSKLQRDAKEKLIERAGENVITQVRQAAQETRSKKEADTESAAKQIGIRAEARTKKAEADIAEQEVKDRRQADRERKFAFEQEKKRAKEEDIRRSEADKEAFKQRNRGKSVEEIFEEAGVSEDSNIEREVVTAEKQKTKKQSPKKQIQQTPQTQSTSKPDSVISTQSKNQQIPSFLQTITEKVENEPSSTKVIEIGEGEALPGTK